MDEIAVVRRLCNQVSVLLEERNSTRISSAVEQLMGNTNLFVYDPAKNDDIQSKLKKAEGVLDGFIESVLPVLRSKLSDSSASKGNVSLNKVEVVNFKMFFRL